MRFPRWMPVIALGAASACSSILGIHDPEIEGANADPDARAADGAPNADGDPVRDGNADGAANTDAGDAGLDVAPEIGPCGADASVVLFDPFPTNTNPPPGWNVEYPSGTASAGNVTFSSVTPPSPAYAVRLNRTGQFGIALRRQVVLAQQTSFELRFDVLLPPTDEVLFAQITKPAVVGPLGIIVRLLAIGGEVRVQRADGTGNPITMGTVPRPSGWTAWSIRLDLINGALVVKAGGLAASGTTTFTVGSTGSLDVFLLAFIDALGATPMPSVEFDDVTGCVP